MNFLNDLKFKKLVYSVLSFLSLFLLASAIYLFTNLAQENSNKPVNNTINVTGSGEVSAVPDVANFTFTVTESGKTLAEAQTKADPKIKKAVDYLKSQGVADVDVKNVPL